MKRNPEMGETAMQPEPAQTADLSKEYRGVLYKEGQLAHETYY